MAIDITNQEAIRKLTLKELIADAAERKDKEAYEWLKVESKTFVKRQVGDKEVEVRKPLISIRAEYLRKFLDYKPNPNNTKSKDKARIKKDKEIDDIFAEFEW